MVNLKYLVLFLLFVLTKVCCRAQDSAEHVIQALRKQLQSDSLRIFQIKKYLPILIIDTRNSFISRARVNILGIQAGIVFMEKDIAGVGGYKIYLPFRIPNKSNLYRLHIQYFTIFYQKVLLDKRFHELDAMMEAGAGKFNVHRIENKEEIFVKSGNFNPLGISLVYTIKPLIFLGVQSMVGYRQVVQKEYVSTFSSPFYSIGVWLSVKDFIRHIKYYWIKKNRYKRAVHKLSEHQKKSVSK